MKRSFLWRLLLLLLVLMALLLPRLLALDHFVNSDERKWLARSANFYTALVHGDWASTFQKEHPGVMVMWAGAAGFAWRYPTYAWDTPDRHFSGEDEALETFLQSQGYRPLDLLIAGRVFMVLAGVLALLLAYWIAIRLLGAPTATLGFLLIAFDPFHIAIARMLHVDGLEANWMFLALVAWLAYLRQGRRSDLIVSALAAGLAWLTKVPALFLAPFVALVVVVELGLVWRHTKQWQWIRVGRWLGAGLAWGGLALVTCGLLWPALWVAPLATLRYVVEYTFIQAGGHGNPIYFNGQVIDSWVDPGFWFYPITYLWRTTPVTLIGLLLAGLTLVWPNGTVGRETDSLHQRRTLVYLLLFAVGFLLFMTIGSKRFDRYLIPIYAPLDLAAAIGWMMMIRWLFRQASPVVVRWAPGIAVAALICAQAVHLLPIWPHVMSYYNPLLGGGAKAPDVMMIGWGEGLDEAARYLNTKPDAANRRAAAWYAIGSFSYFFDGHTQAIEFEKMADISRWLDLDYIVTYIHLWQRRWPDPRLLDYLAGYAPEQRITINHMDYAQVYDLGTIPPPPYLAPGRTPRVVDWDNAIRLLGYALPAQPLQPGESFAATFYLQNIAASSPSVLAKNLNVLVRITDVAGRQWLRAEGWPWGSPTAQWPPQAIWEDGHQFVLPAEMPAGLYRIELSFYDPATLDSLPAVDAQTGAALGTLHVVDYLTVGTPPVAATPLAHLGDKIELLAANSVPTTTVAAGESLVVRLAWTTNTPLTIDYTSFIHLLDSSGTLVAQHDKQPQASFLPTHLWQPGAVVNEEYTLLLPTDARPGQYQLYVGMVDATGQRLPVQQADQPAADTVLVAEIGVK